ncbi:MAG: hypothetical protein J7497_08140, partial [Chitinophagaceae bacterium]|nr:hypothetical protein [Chitinophagaceae bacterium]
MNSINNGLELAQIGWVVPDIRIAVKFLGGTMGIAGFPEPQHVRAQDLNMTYYGKVVDAEWLTTQTFNGGTFIEWPSSIHIKRLALLPRLWALHPKDIKCSLTILTERKKLFSYLLFSTKLLVLLIFE